MSRACDRGTELLGRFPRVSGDEPLPLIISAGVQLFSPRERG